MANKVTNLQYFKTTEIKKDIKSQIRKIEVGCYVKMKWKKTALFSRVNWREEQGIHMKRKIYFGVSKNMAW